MFLSPLRVLYLRCFIFVDFVYACLEELCDVSMRFKFLAFKELSRMWSGGGTSPTAVNF